MRFFTTTLTSSSQLTINLNDGVMFLSVKTDSVSGSATISGNFPFKGINSSPTPLSAGDGANMSALSPQSPLDGITIQWVGGNVDIILGF
jgi:hypothetical protein